MSRALLFKVTGLVIGALVLTIAGVRVLDRDRCAPLNDEPKTTITSWVGKKYGLTASALELRESLLIEGSCFRKLTFEGGSPRCTFTLFLTPDQRHLAGALFDLTREPEESARASSNADMGPLLAEESPSLGSNTAPVTIVEFSDFECPFCRRLENTLVKEVLPSEAGKVRLVFKHYPLSIHPWGFRPDSCRKSKGVFS